MSTYRSYLKSTSIYYPIDEYELFRPLYPNHFFLDLGLHFERLYQKAPDRFPLTFLDLGCGTAQVARSAEQAWQHQVRPTAEPLKWFKKHSWNGLDLDPKAILEADTIWTKQYPEISAKWFEGQAHKTPFLSSAFDAIFIGSALHWMTDQKNSVSDNLSEQGSLNNELSRILKPGGRLVVFEYQFPKLVEFPELNAWIKSEFNNNWKPNNQAPRGKLRHITGKLLCSFEQDRTFNQEVRWVAEIPTQQFIGILFTQKRFLHYLSTIQRSGAAEYTANSYKASIQNYIENQLKGKPSVLVDFKSSRIILKLRAV